MTPLSTVGFGPPHEFDKCHTPQLALDVVVSAVYLDRYYLRACRRDRVTRGFAFFLFVVVLYGGSRSAFFQFVMKRRLIRYLDACVSSSMCRM